MNKKLEIIKSESHPDKFRLIINVTSEFSTSVILEKEQLAFFFNELKELLKKG